MFAGRREAPGAMHVDSCYSELVPSAGSYVTQRNAFVCGLGKWYKSTEHPFTVTQPIGACV